MGTQSSDDLLRFTIPRVVADTIEIGVAAARFADVADSRISYRHDLEEGLEIVCSRDVAIALAGRIAETADDERMPRALSQQCAVAAANIAALIKA